MSDKTPSIKDRVGLNDVLPFLIFKANYRLLKSENNAQIAFDEFKKFQKLARNTVFNNHNTFENTDVHEKLATIQQAVFCSFHIGPYRVILDYLLSKEYNIVLLISNGAFEAQSLEIIQLLNLRKQNSLNDGELIILNINEKSTFFKLKMYMQKGFSIMTYLDANTDVQDETSSIVEFLGRRIFVNNGILKLSRLLNIPIVPIFSCWLGNEIQISVESKIQVLEKGNEYLTKITQLLFSLLHEKLLITPNQWEGWAYIDEWFIDQFDNQINLENQISQITFNSYNYEIATISDRSFLYDLNCQRFYELNNDEFELLSLLKNANINFNKLFEKQILIIEKAKRE